jgi:hypothetical protein
MQTRNKINSGEKINANWNMYTEKMRNIVLKIDACFFSCRVPMGSLHNINGHMT